MLEHPFVDFKNHALYGMVQALRGRHIAAWLMGAITAVAVFAGIAARDAHATVTSTNLGVTSFGRILVDSAHSHIFISSPGANDIVVTDLGGSIVKTITGEAGADAMTIVGSTLYVTLTTAGAIDRIDTTTLTETSELVTGLVVPRDLIYAGSKLWTTTGNCAAWSLELASVDPAAATPTVTKYSSAFGAGNGLGYCAAFATNHAFNPGFFVAWDLGLDPATITSFDVSSGSPVQGASQDELNLGNLQDVVINPDQTHFITASGSPYEFDEWNISDMSQDGVIYPGNTYPTSVDSTSSNGGVMVGGLNGIYNEDFDAYRIGNPAIQLAKADFGGTNNTVPSRGVAISPDGQTGYAISGGSGSGIVLNLVPLVIGPPPPSPSPTPTATPSPSSTPTASPSATPSPSPSPSGAPGPPTNVTADAGVGSVTVGWTPPADHGGSDITGYTVTSSGGAVVNVGPSVISVTIAGLSPTTHTFEVTATNSQGTGPPSASSPPATPSDGGTYRPLTPFRVLDTRDGTGGVPAHRVAGGGIVTLHLAGVDGIPLVGVSAVALNVTVTGPTGAGYVTAYPSDQPRPLASNLNYVAGQTVPNLVEVAVSATGDVSLYVGGSSTNLVADLEGWVGDSTDSYGGAGLLGALAPTRILDTRNGTGVTKGKLGPGGSITLQVTGNGGVPASHVAAVILNVTVTNPTQAGYLTVYPSDAASRPLASNLNFVAGQTIANRVIVPLSADGKVTIYNASGTVDVIADVNAWITDSTGTGGLSFVATVPSRLVDTRTCNCKFGPGYVLDLQWVGSPFIVMFVFNVTATNTTGNGYLTLYPNDGSLGQGTPPSRPTSTTPRTGRCRT